MSLRSKFAILLILLAVTISGSMAMVLWAYGLQRSQLLGPFANTPEVIDRLRRLAENTDEQARLLRSAAGENVPARAPNRDRVDADEPGAGDTIEAFDSLSDRTRALEDFVTAQIALGTRGGTIASRTLVEKVHALQSKGHEALEQHDASKMKSAAAIAPEISALVSSQNNRLLGESVSAIETVEAVRRKLLLSVVWAFLSAALLGMLALILVRRWVLRPVAGLRTAAGRIGAGDFRHRISTQGNDELAQLGAEVNHMAATIERMLAERVERERLAAVGEMVRRLAHNLRNPLSGIRGLAELTRDEVRGQPDLHDAQQRIIDSVDRFERWLADLLSVTRPLAVNPERSPVAPLLLGLIEAHRPLARTKEISLRLDADEAPEEAVFDPRHLEHSLVAILTNAIQATPARSTVWISARSDADGDAWEIRISDQGPGVPPELVEKIFNAYFTTKRDGNGIGLAVAQQVVRAHGGKITVEPRIGGGDPAPGAARGATFVVRLPLSPPDGAPENGPTPPATQMAT